jgi:competence protein ComEA
MKIVVNSSSGKNHITLTQIEAGKRLALGIKFDINKATQEDLLLVKGIGEATAQKILDLRGKLCQFRNIEQLMEIKGIKEKKLAEISKYLYIEKP